MLAHHSIIDTMGAYGRLKVVWTDWSRDAVFTVDVDDPTSPPETHVGQELEREIVVNRWKVEAGEAPAFIPDHVYVGSAEGNKRARKRAEARKKHLELRDEAWAIVQPLLATTDVFDRKRRAELVASASAAAIAAGKRGASAATITNNLMKVFHRGMAKDALRPSYEECGNPGDPRPVREGGKKSGPPPKDGNPKGTPVTEAMKKVFRVGFDLHDAVGKVKLVDAFHHCLRVGFWDAVQKLRQEFGKNIPDAAYEKLGLPRYEQFVYHYHRERKRWRAEIKRLGSSVYARRHRPLLGNSTDEAWGPGARYQIDATQIDVYARSRRNRRRLVWRPTLYVVVDVWTRMIAGFALSLDPPSWIGAMTALANAMTTKVDFCAKYGVEIDEDDWPTQHLCAILEGDNGEMKSSGVLGLISQFGVTVGNVTAYRPDWKGIVERRFGLIHAMLKPHVPGFVHADFRERGAEDYRLETAYDLDELTRAIIICVLHYNNHHRIEDYPLLPEMIADKVPAVPAEMWRWGVAALGLPQRAHPEAVKFALLEQGTAVRRRTGLFFKGASYSFADAVDAGWFDKVSMTGRGSVPISFDRRFTDVIYVHDAKAPFGFRVAELTDKRFAGASFWELVDEQEQAAGTAAWADLRETAEGIAKDKDLDDDRQRAQAAMARTAPAPSAAAETSGIRDATREERVLDTVEQVSEYHADMSPRATSAATVPPPVCPAAEAAQGRQSNDNHAMPSLADRLKGRN